MSRIEELKKQNPNYQIDTIAIINELFEKIKYTELSMNLIKKSNRISDGHIYDITNELVKEYEVDKNLLSTKTNEQIHQIFRVVTDYFGHTNFMTLKKFIKLNERNLITQKDLSQFTSFEELQNQISLAELKLLDKDMEKQTIKLLETNEWLVIKPMSFLASKKYGASTKWCTTQESNPDYYLRYSRRGILIYCINKLSGIKVACFKNTDKAYDPETSFWNMIDNRIDSLESDLPTEVLELIRNEFKTQESSNWDLLSDEERTKQLLWIESEYYDKKGYDIEPMGLAEPTPHLDEEQIPMTGQPVNEVLPRRARIIPMSPRAVYEDGPDQAG